MGCVDNARPNRTQFVSEGCALFVRRPGEGGRTCSGLGIGVPPGGAL